MAANYLNGSYRMLKTVVLGMTGIFLLLSADPADAQFRSPNDVDTTPGSSEPAATSAEFGFSTAYRSELVRQIIPPSEPSRVRKCLVGYSCARSSKRSYGVQPLRQ